MLRPVFGHSRRLAGRALFTQRQFCVAGASVTQAQVLRHGPAGVLVSGALGEGGAEIDRGCVVDHEGGRFVCAFRVGSYWFATPLSGGAGWQQWRGGAARSLEEGRDSAASVVACLRTPTPTQKERVPLAEGLPTGVIALDTLAPVGKGQSLLFCGPRGTGKSSMACEVLERVLSTRHVDQAIRFRLDESAPALDDAVQDGDSFAELVVSTEAAAEQDRALLLPSMLEAVAAAEKARDAGQHALLVLDTVEPLIDAWRQAVSWVEEVSGKGLESELAQVERRGCFSNLLERAALLAPSDNRSGGSLTLLVLAETEAMAALGAGSAPSSSKSSTENAVTYEMSEFASRKQSEQDRLQRLVDRGIPLTASALKALGVALPVREGSRGGWEDEVAAMREMQSLSDGQVIFDSSAAERGQFPTVMPGATFSRFGLGSSGAGGADSQSVPSLQSRRDVRPPALQAVAAHLRIELALEQEARFRPASTDPQGAEIMDGAHSHRMRAVRAALLQPLRTPLRSEEMTVLLLAACSGALDQLTLEQAAYVLQGGSHAPLLQYFKTNAPQVLSRIAEEEHVSVATARELDVTARLFAALQRAGAA